MIRYPTDYQRLPAINFRRRPYYYNRAFRNLCILTAILSGPLTGLYAYFWHLILKQPTSTDGLVAENMGLGLFSMVTVDLFLVLAFLKKPFDVLREAGLLALVLSSTMAASLSRLYSSMDSVSDFSCSKWGPNGAGCWAIQCMSVIGCLVSAVLVIVVSLLVSQNYRGNTTPCHCLSMCWGQVARACTSFQGSDQPPPYFPSFPDYAAAMGSTYSQSSGLVPSNQQPGTLQIPASAPPAYAPSNATGAASFAGQGARPVAPVVSLPGRQVSTAQLPVASVTPAQPVESATLQTSATAPATHEAATEPL